MNSSSAQLWLASRAPVLDEYVLFGLLSTSKSYKLVWALNQILAIHLTKSAHKSFASVFPFYAYDAQNESYRLIGNHSYDTVAADTRARLGSKQLHWIDYLFLAKSASSESSLLANLRNCALIRYVFALPPSALSPQLYGYI